MKHVERTRQKVVLFFVDLDRLKQISDRMGHQAGDRATKDAATVLATAFRKSDIVARLGGDEFVVLATDAAAEHADQPMERVQELVRRNASSPPRRSFWR